LAIKYRSEFETAFWCLGAPVIGFPPKLISIGIPIEINFAFRRNYCLKLSKVIRISISIVEIEISISNQNIIFYFFSVKNALKFRPLYYNIVPKSVLRSRNRTSDSEIEIRIGITMSLSNPKSNFRFRHRNRNRNSDSNIKILTKSVWHFVESSNIRKRNFGKSKLTV
jgi:hypothetical protein